MLPDDKDTPANGLELFFVKPVPFDVPLELPPPEIRVSLRERFTMERTPVPEASVHKNGELGLEIDEIRAARQHALSRDALTKKSRQNQFRGGP